MRKALIALLLIVFSASEAGAWGGVCGSVERHSLWNIDCSKVKTEDGKVYVLRYKSNAAFRITENSGRKHEMIAKLCNAGGLLVREVNGSKTYVHICTVNTETEIAKD
jgi:hypothetical protein